MADVKFYKSCISGIIGPIVLILLTNLTISMKIYQVATLISSWNAAMFIEYKMADIISQDRRNYLSNRPHFNNP